MGTLLGHWEGGSACSGMDDTTVSVYSTAVEDGLATHLYPEVMGQLYWCRSTVFRIVKAGNEGEAAFR